MCRLIVTVLALFAVLFSASAVAEVRSFDLSVMSVEELESLADEVKVAKKAAVAFSSEVFGLLKPNFMETVEQLAPDAIQYDYPILGLNRDRERTYYAISGSITARFSDKTKTEYKDVTIVYWHDLEKDIYHQVAFFSRNEVYFVRQELLENIERYVDDKVFKKLVEKAGSINNVANIQNSSVSPSPTPTPTPTPSPSPTPTSVPTPTPTPSPTPTPKPVLKKGAQGDAVIEMQELLIENDYLSGVADGKFGNATVNAIKDFQINNDLRETGVWAEDEWRAASNRYCVPQRAVYRSKSGKVYHEYSTCSGMKTAKEMTLSQALRNGLRECEHCH